MHPQLLEPRLVLGPEALIQRAHGNGLLQFAHALVTLNTALLVVIALHFMKRLEGTTAAWAGLVGAACAVVGACLLAADKGALCLTMSALDTIPEPQFAPRIIETIIEKTTARKGVLDPLGAAIQAGPGHYPTLMRALANDLKGCLANPV